MSALLLALTVAATPAQLGWLGGCWAFERDGRRYEEVWLAPASNALIGVARTLSDGRSVHSEQLAIVAGDDGALEYVATPERQSLTRFRLVELKGQRAVFANPAHDFPKRIVYHRRGADALDALVEGDSGKRIEYPFRRAECPVEP